MTPEAHAKEGLALLRQALASFKAAGSPRTVERIRHAIASADGAVRHAGHKTRRLEAGAEALTIDLSEYVN